MTAVNWAKYLANSDWERVQGKVLELSDNWQESQRPHFNFIYQYNFHGSAPYSKDIRLCVFRDKENGRKMHNRLKKLFSTGGPIVVFVNPSDPKSAYIFRELTFSMFLYPLIAVLFLGVMLFKYRKDKNKKTDHC